MIIPNEDLRMLCIKNNWFTCGSCEQYEKLFMANRFGMPLEQIAVIIWTCSNEKWLLLTIINELEKAQKEYDDLYDQTVADMERQQAAGERAADEIYCGYFD